MNTFKKMAPYVLLCAVAIYILPLFGQTTGGFMLILIVLIPFICFLTSLVYGLKQDWNFLYPIIVGLLFAPTVFLYYNSSAWVYIVGYSFLSFVGIYIGKSIKDNNRKKAR